MRPSMMMMKRRKAHDHSAERFFSSKMPATGILGVLLGQWKKRRATSEIDATCCSSNGSLFFSSCIVSSRQCIQKWKRIDATIGIVPYFFFSNTHCLVDHRRKKKNKCEQLSFVSITIQTYLTRRQPFYVKKKYVSSAVCVHTKDVVIPTVTCLLARWMHSPPLPFPLFRSPIS